MLTIAVARPQNLMLQGNLGTQQRMSTFKSGSTNDSALFVAGETTLTT
jgi:hypothetical protein